MNKKSNKNVYIAAALLFCAGFGWLIFSGLSENSVYFLNVSEALATDQEHLRSARLFGTVAAADLKMSDGAPGVDFRLLDKDNPAQSIMVSYKGAVPDTFKPGVEVIVEGGLLQGGTTFGASSLMTKCPSKYKKQQGEG
ncbi:MAG: cytochrome c maturation protein CcmE [Desulfovibrionaceae bacterium]